MSAVERWNEKLAELEANRNGRIPKDRATEDRIVGEMEAIHAELSDAERRTVRRPQAPRYIETSMDLIALDGQGRLIGYEDLDDDRY